MTSIAKYLTDKPTNKTKNFRKTRTVKSHLSQLNINEKNGLKAENLNLFYKAIDFHLLNLMQNFMSYIKSNK